MKRTVKVWVAAVMSGVLLAGGAAMTGQAPWGMEAQAHSGRTDASGGHRDNKNASGLGSYHYHCGGHPAHLHPNGVCPYAGGGESTQTQTRAQTKTQTQAQTQAQAPAQTQAQAPAQAQTQPQEQAVVRAASGAGEASGTSGWHQNGAYWNYICEDGTRVIGCWKQIDGVWYSCRLPRYLTKPRQRRSEWDMAGSDGISRVSAVFRGKSLLTNKMRII
ncbi:YHYH domain-containing protein [Enterocloster bolteae]|uniref:YHYH domain-containing protein n=1 Tax=Enterocloster bolteae TaxID=208479 RepID=UPI003AB1ADD0